MAKLVAAAYPYYIIIGSGKVVDILRDILA
jgi:hypothetical protein